MRELIPLHKRPINAGKISEFDGYLIKDALKTIVFLYIFHHPRQEVHGPQLKEKNMKNSKPVAIMLSAIMLVSCTEPNGAPGRGFEHGGALNKEDVGTAVGVVGGGIIGSTIGGGAGRTIAIIGGGLLGGILGNSVGKSLDRADMASYEQASQNAMETGHTRTWKNGDNHGKIVPYKRYTNDEGQYCREYTQTIYVGDERHQGHGTACRESDGTWRIVE